MPTAYYRELNNKLTAAKRQHFLSHSIIRLGKTLYDKFDRFKAVFWKDKENESTYENQPKPKRAYKKRIGIKNSNDDPKKNVSQRKEVQIDPTILEEQKKRILILMNKVKGIKIQKKIFL